MKKKILITGISSSILSVLASKIDTSLYDIYGFTRNRSYTALDLNMHVIYGDLLDETTYLNHIKNIDLLIHGAAITHSKKEKAYYAVNYEATKRLVDNAIGQGVKRFIFISSNTANPNNGAYSHSKFLAEKYIMSTFPNWQIYRISQVFGVKTKDEGIEKLIHQTLHKKVLLSPLGITSKLYPIHVEDAANNIINTMLGSSENQKININGNEPFTYSSLIDIVANIDNKRIQKIGINKQIMYVAKYVASILPLGFVPDQVDRLYGEKTYSAGNQISITLKDYIKTLLT